MADGPAAGRSRKSAVRDQGHGIAQPAPGQGCRGSQHFLHAGGDVRGMHEISVTGKIDGVFARAGIQLQYVAAGRQKAPDVVPHPFSFVRDDGIARIISIEYQRLLTKSPGRSLFIFDHNFFINLRGSFLIYSV